MPKGDSREFEKGGHPPNPRRDVSLHSLRTGTEGCTSFVILAEAGIQKMLTVGSVSRTENHSEDFLFTM